MGSILVGLVLSLLGLLSDRDRTRAAGALGLTVLNILSLF